MFNKPEYDKKFDKDHYFHMNLVLPKSYKALIEQAAKKRGLSKNGYVRAAIDEKMNAENSAQEQ